MSHTFTRADVRALAVLAQEAGALIMRLRAEARDLGVLEKADGSPVSHADHLAQTHILNGLEKLGLAAPTIAEETVQQVDIKHAAGFYLIDPLDGTKAFLAGQDDFTVNIGYVEKGVPIMGVLHVPALHETYYSDGIDAFFQNVNSAEEKIQARQADVNAYDVITNRTEDWSGRLKDYLKNYKVRHVERLSSAHKLGLIARGRFDLYPRFGRTCEWDIAAGDAILRAAGGCVEMMDGTPMLYGKEGFFNPPFVAKGRG